MIKKLLYILLVACILTNVCSCALFQKTIDSKTGFSNHLEQTEKYIRDGDWENAKVSLKDSQKTWEKLKPMLQVDIDHDYIYNIEEDFVKLGGYIDAKDEGNSLATILLIKDTWENIGTL